MRVTNEIFEVGGGSFTSPRDAAVYLIVFNGHAALVDAGCGGSLDRLMDNIQRCNVNPRDVEYLLITHCHYDHTGGVDGVKEMTKCQVVAHELDAQYLERGDNTVTAARWYGASLDPMVIDRKLSIPREEIHLGNHFIQAIHTPGHSPGSVVYVTESQGLKVLFGQDVHGPLDPGLLSNRDDYLRSLHLLLTLEADILCEGHYGVIRGKSKVREFIRSFIPVS